LNEGVVVGDDGTYAGFPYLGGFYVAVNSDATTIAPLLFEHYWPEDVITLATEDSFDLGANYSLRCNQIDVEGDKVWLSLLKNGEEIDSDVLDTTTANGSLFVARDDFADQKDAIYFTTYADKLFQGQTDSFVKLKYTWLADKDDITYITTDDTFGVFECIQAEADEIVFANSNSISLKFDGATYLTDDMYLCASDEGLSESGGFNIYPAMGVTIEESTIEELKPAEEDMGNSKENFENSEVVNETLPAEMEVIESDSNSDLNSSSDVETSVEAPGFGILSTMLGICLAIGYSKKW
jgi:S-layer protein (TIGR01567 family)